ncbi:MAG TPA: TlpA disulfide reductase family protein [Chitinophagaceae bacterium]
MKKKLLVSLCIFFLGITKSNGQLFSLSDTTITFKNQEGKILTKDEVKEFMKGVFSIRQQNINGKKIITIIPRGNDERTLQLEKIDALKNSLVGNPLTSFHLTDLDNNEWDLDKLKGKALVINFWFTACKPCILEMPYLNKLVADNKDSVVFIAPAPENETQIKRFLKKYSFEYNIIPSAADFMTSMSIENFPTHLVVDKEGIIRQVFIGYADDIKEKLQVEINKLNDNGNE